MQEKGWGHKHKEGGRSSGEIAEDAEAVRFQDQVTEIFAEQLFEWEEKINSKDTITKAEFGQLFGGFYDKVKKSFLKNQLKRIQEEAGEHKIFPYSAEKKIGVRELTQEILS